MYFLGIFLKTISKKIHVVVVVGDINLFCSIPIKKAAHMLGYVDLLSRLSIEMNTIWEPIIEKAQVNCF